MSSYTLAGETLDVSRNGTAATLAVETTSDPRTDKRAFSYEYAVAYAFRVLSGDRTRKAKGTAPKRIVDRRTGGSDGRPKDTRPITRFRKSAVPEAEPYSWQEEKASRKWEEKLNAEVYDLAQSAAVLFFAAKNKAKETKDDSHRIDTRGAIRFAVRDWRRSQSRRKGRKRCSSCRFDSSPCDDCTRRAEKEREDWARMNRPTALAREVSESLSEVTCGPDWHTAVAELLPADDGLKTRKHVRMIIRCIASGSTITETAEVIGVSQPYVSKLLSTLRQATSPADYVSTVGSVKPISDRIYGDRPGSARGAGLSLLLDLLDTMLGHAAGDYQPTTPDHPRSEDATEYRAAVIGFHWDGSGI